MKKAQDSRDKGQGSRALARPLSLAACTLLLLAGCRPQTPADKTAALRAIVQVSCAKYLLDTTLPRDRYLDASCSNMKGTP